jgi:hypothetical protein
MRNAYKILVREPEWKSSLGRGKRKFKENNEMDNFHVTFVVPCIINLLY